MSDFGYIQMGSIDKSFLSVYNIRYLWTQWHSISCHRSFCTLFVKQNMAQQRIKCISLYSTTGHKTIENSSISAF